jgi:hypothetical protein
LRYCRNCEQQAQNEYGFLHSGASLARGHQLPASFQ